MTQGLRFLMHGEPAGTITRQRGRLQLRYADSYRRPTATPLSVSLPVQVAEHTHEPVSAFLWGLLPDNDRVLQRWARIYQVSAADPTALLSSPVGADCAGAVQFSPPGRVEEPTSVEGGIDWLAESDVAAKLRLLAHDSADWLGERVKTGHFSLAGAQAKTALRYDPGTGRWGTPHGPEPTTHILKPGIADLEGHALNEHLCLATARALGLRAAGSQIRTFEEQTAVVVRRFDRVTRDGRVLRIHQEDLCQALAVHPDGKYQSDGGPSPEDIVDLLRRVLPAGEAEKAIARFVDGLLFNWLIGGTDAHGKNYGLLLSGSQVRFAPLYDLASMLPYEHDPKQLALAMKIGGEYRFKAIRPRNWVKLADVADLDVGRVIGRARELAERVPDALADACSTDAVATLGTPLPSRMLTAVAAWSRRCGRLLDGFRSDGSN